MSTATMSPIDWAKRPIQKYADFSGRAPRSEYWWYVLATIIAYAITTVLDAALGLDGMVGPYGILGGLLMLALIVPGLAVTVRRLHDTDRSGWWVLVAVIPYFIVGVTVGMAAASGSMAGFGTAGLVSILALCGAIVLLVFMVLPGTPGDNRFGPNPFGNPAPTAPG